MATLSIVMPLDKHAVKVGVQSYCYEYIENYATLMFIFFMK